jgi:uncharacterized membrane protein YidH (DUF202 family)
MIRFLLAFGRTGTAFVFLLLWAWTRGQPEQVREVGDIIAFVAIGLAVMSAWDRDRTRLAKRKADNAK